MVNLNSGLKANIIKYPLSAKITPKLTSPLTAYTLKLRRGTGKPRWNLPHHLRNHRRHRLHSSHHISLYGWRSPQIPPRPFTSETPGWVGQIFLITTQPGNSIFGKDYIMDPLKTTKVLIQENTPAYVGYITIIYKPKE